MVTKSCSQGSCRDPWRTLHPAGDVHNLAEALAAKHDMFYANLPRVAFQTCLPFQLRENETPFYPSGAVELGASFRDKSAADILQKTVTGTALIADDCCQGAVYEGATKVLASARELTDAELGLNGTMAAVTKKSLFSERLAWDA